MSEGRKQDARRRAALAKWGKQMRDIMATVWQRYPVIEVPGRQAPEIVGADWRP